MQPSLGDIQRSPRARGLNILDLRLAATRKAVNGGRRQT